MKLFFSLLLIGLFFHRQTLAGHGASFALEQIGAQTGLGLNLNYSLDVYENTFLKLNYLELFTYLGKSDNRFRKETISGGTEICRDTTNGQFADKENCNPPLKAEYQPSIEAQQRINERIYFGLGVKLRPLWNSSPVYGIASFNTSEARRIVFRAGSEYLSFGYEMLF